MQIYYYSSVSFDVVAYLNLGILGIRNQILAKYVFETVDLGYILALVT